MTDGQTLPGLSQILMKTKQLHKTRRDLEMGAWSLQWDASSLVSGERRRSQPLKCLLICRMRSIELPRAKPSKVDEPWSGLLIAQVCSGGDTNPEHKQLCTQLPECEISRTQYCFWKTYPGFVILQTSCLTIRSHDYGRRHYGMLDYICIPSSLLEI